MNDDNRNERLNEGFDLGRISPADVGVLRLDATPVTFGADCMICGTFIEGVRIPVICDYCIQRFTWDCEDSRVPDNDSCDSFCLDWNTLSNDAKDRLQKWIMLYRDHLTKD